MTYHLTAPGTRRSAPAALCWPPRRWPYRDHRPGGAWAAERAQAIVFPPWRFSSERVVHTPGRSAAGLRADDQPATRPVPGALPSWPKCPGGHDLAIFSLGHGPGASLNRE
ncbi:hypothetical protein DSL92_05685 [Billgrantia gudaonensis]|uniref:Uncharacterized protein n=1 Tax=Billgrantia gudaonensis TaxID=376427 RepID=A0A432JJB6_9GAMM|nr:hypothetical protein DSL92_05685 [Halomonas gudaonensis]